VDPLCHSLVGASLAHAGLRRITPLATATLVIGANLPDVDGITYLVNQDLALGVRRGWTHGVLAMAVWPFALAGVMLAVEAWRRRRRPERRPVKPARLLLVACIAVLSHPALDWLNAYGIRLLMPFSGRWYYGDAAFIVDPWMWVLPGAAVALATSRRFSSMAAWLVLGALTTTAVLMGPGSTTPVRVAWTVAMVAIVAMRWLGATPLAKVRVARAGLVLLVVYVLALKVVSLDLARRAELWLDERGVASEAVAALPVPGRPFTREMVATTASQYLFLRSTWLDSEPAVSGPPAPLGGPTEITAAAMSAPQVWGLATWIRLPSYEVQRLGDGYRVLIRDVRFWRPGRRTSDLGGATVDLDRELRPVATDARAVPPARVPTVAPRSALAFDPCLGPAIAELSALAVRLPE
jgi:inner membrane protein